MRPRRVFAVILRQIYLLRGGISRILPLFAWVAVDMILWGFMTKYLNSIASPGFNFIPALLGAVLLWDFFIRVMFGVTTAFLEDVWSRNFINFFAAPLSIAEYVLGLVCTSICTSFVGLVVMVVLSWCFGLSFFSYGLPLFPFLFVLFLFGIALGIVGSAIVLRLGPASEWFIWPLPALISPLAGVFYPITTLPHWMQSLARLLPPSYVFEGIRSIVAGHGVSFSAMITSMLLVILYVVMGGYFFSRTYRQCVRSGLLARYSAESVA